MMICSQARDKDARSVCVTCMLKTQCILLITGSSCAWKQGTKGRLKSLFLILSIHWMMLISVLYPPLWSKDKESVTTFLIAPWKTIKQAELFQYINTFLLFLNIMITIFCNVYQIDRTHRIFRLKTQVQEIWISSPHSASSNDSERPLWHPYPPSKFQGNLNQSINKTAAQSVGN